MNRPYCRSLAVHASWSLLLVVAAGCRSASIDNEVDLLIKGGQYDAALNLAAEKAEGRPNDPGVQHVYRRALVSNLLARGRTATFDDDDRVALAHFNRALEIAPDNPVVQAWVDKTKRKLADTWLDTAYERNNSNDLEGAEEAFQEVLKWVPDDPRAREGEANVLLRKGWRAGLGEAYYYEGVRALKRAEFVRAKQHFDYVAKYVEDEQALKRGKKVDQALALERLDVARGFEADGLFNASKNEFRLALLLDPELELAKRGFDRTAREAQADVFLDEADMHMRRGDLDAARVSIDRGKLLSASDERFDAMLLRIDAGRLREIYDRAYAYEIDFQIEKAIGTYEALLLEAPTFEDAETRLATLREQLEQAPALYAAAAAATTLDEREELLLQIEAFWPDYSDVETQLEAIAVERAAAAAAAAAAAEVDDEP